MRFQLYHRNPSTNHRLASALQDVLIRTLALASAVAFTGLGFMGICCCAVPQTVRAADGVSDVYLWYYNVDPADIDTSLDGTGETVRRKARAGLDPRDPGDGLHEQIEHIPDNDPPCLDRFVFTWKAKKGIFYRAFSSPVLDGPDADWQPEGDDWVQATESGINAILVFSFMY
jgi:hypothetical protein